MNKRSIKTENKQVLNENALETFLLAAGFVPVIGELFDIISIIRYCYRKEYIYAGLMIIALIPTVGDIVAKSVLGTLKALRGSKAILTAADVVKITKGHTKIANQFVKASKYTNHSKVQTLVKQLEKVSPRLGNMFRNALRSLEETAILIAPKATGIAKNVSREVAMGTKKPFQAGFKKYFQDKKIKDFALKYGKEPSEFVKTWYKFVARGERRNYVRKLIMKSNLLAFFGLPSFEMFHEKMVNDKQFRKQLADNEEFSNIVDQSSTEEDLALLAGQETPETKDKKGGISGAGILGGLVGGYLGVQALKYLARVLIK